MNKGKKEGITLIALIVTIIVLLILAGVSVQILIGENGLIDRTIDAKEEYAISTAKEILQIELAGINPSDSDVQDKLIDALINASDKINQIDGVKAYIKDNTIIIESGQKAVKVSLDLNTRKTTWENVDGFNLIYDKNIIKYGTSPVNVQLKAELYKNGRKINGNNVTYHSSATIIATISEKGILTTKSEGKTKVYASCNYNGQTYRTEETEFIIEGLSTGDNIRYEVPYKDVYSGIDYSGSDGWKYLGKTIIMVST